MKSGSPVHNWLKSSTNSVRPVQVTESRPLLLAQHLVGLGSLLPLEQVQHWPHQVPKRLSQATQS